MYKNKIIRILASFWLITAIAGCASQQPSAYVSQLENRIWDSGAGRFISKEEFYDAVLLADYIILGETHDNPAHHEIQSDVLQLLLDNNRRPAVVMEMLDVSDQPAIDKFISSPRDSAEFNQAVGFAKKGWDWSLYQPLVEQALEEKLTIRGGNLPRKSLQGLFRGKPVTDNPELTALLDLAEDFPDSVKEGLRQEIKLSHCGKLPDSMVGGMMQAQTARDAMLALQMQNAGKPAIMITGSGHARVDRAVPFFLSQIDADSRILSLGMKGVNADFQTEQRQSWESLFDFSWYTEAVVREDPCLKFKAPVSAEKQP